MGRLEPVPIVVRRPVGQQPLEVVPRRKPCVPGRVLPVDVATGFGPVRRRPWRPHGSAPPSAGRIRCAWARHAYHPRSTTIGSLDNATRGQFTGAIDDAGAHAAHDVDGRDVRR